MPVSRNTPCPCGSGKKYKRCCGAGAATQTAPSIPRLLQQSQQALHSGQLQVAESLLRQVRGNAPGSADACNLLAVVCDQTGRTDEAIGLLTTAARLKPKNVQYLYNLGTVLFGLARYAEAIVPLSRAVGLKPDWAELNNNLGASHAGLRHFQEAQTYLEAAIRLKPDYGEAHDNLGTVLLAQKENDAARETLQKARQLLPQSQQVLNNLANAEAACGHYQEAKALYREVLERSSDLDVRKNLILLEQANQRHGDALDELHRAVLQAPADPGIHYLMSISEEGLDRYEAALRCLTKAGELGFSASALEVRKGNIHKLMGDFDAAIGCYKQALEIDPKLVGAFAAIAQVSKSNDLSFITERIEQALETLKLPVQMQIRLHFALGKQYDDAGEFDRAFGHYQQGNALRSGKDYADYSVAGFREEVSRLIGFFSPEFIRSFSHFGSHSDRPIIIFGMPRSGTTLTEQVLAAHPQVFGAGELGDFPKLTKHLGSTECKDDWPLGLAKLDQARFTHFAGEYLEHLKALDAGAVRVANKMPHNFLHLGLIYLLFPKASYVHCARNPLDNCLSIYFQNFGGNHPYAYDLNILGEYYREYQRLVDHWKKVLPVPILEMNYEQTVSDFESSARSLVKFCGLPWDDACLAFHQKRRAIKTASVWQVRQQIYTGSVERWRNYSKGLEPLLQVLGETG